MRKVKLKLDFGDMDSLIDAMEYHCIRFNGYGRIELQMSVAAAQELHEILLTKARHPFVGRKKWSITFLQAIALKMILRLWNPQNDYHLAVQYEIQLQLEPQLP